VRSRRQSFMWVGDRGREQTSRETALGTPGLEWVVVSKRPFIA
jgi:hypothetical protein